MNLPSMQDKQLFDPALSQVLHDESHTLHLKSPTSPYLPFGQVKMQELDSKKEFIQERQKAEVVWHVLHDELQS
jgi:hypothetical protein